MEGKGIHHVEVPAEQRKVKRSRDPFVPNELPGNGGKSYAGLALVERPVYTQRNGVGGIGTFYGNCLA